MHPARLESQPNSGRDTDLVSENNVTLEGNPPGEASGRTISLVTRNILATLERFLLEEDDSSMDMGLVPENNDATLEGNPLGEAREGYEGENGDGAVTPGKRGRKRLRKPKNTSIYKGVRSSRNVGCFEAFLWNNSDPKDRKTVYIGRYDTEEMAARAYDLATIKLFGDDASTNFPLADYEEQLNVMKNVPTKDYLHYIRRLKRGFSKGHSNYRGVSRSPDQKKWQVRIGKSGAIRGIYVGTFDTEEEAARAYDKAILIFKGMNAATNFNKSQYDIPSMLDSGKISIGKGLSKCLMNNEVQQVISEKRNTDKVPILHLEVDEYQAGTPIYLSPAARLYQHQRTLSNTRSLQGNRFQVNGLVNHGCEATNAAIIPGLAGVVSGIMEHNAFSNPDYLGEFTDTGLSNGSLTTHDISSDVQKNGCFQEKNGGNGGFFNEAGKETTELDLSGNWTDIYTKII